MNYRAILALSLLNYGITTAALADNVTTYTPIKPNFELLTADPKHNDSWHFVGINLAGFEFSKDMTAYTAPNISKEGADVGEMRSFIHAGMNTIRVPLNWSYLQPDGAGKGDLNIAYYNAMIKPLLETLTPAEVYTIIDLHNNMRYPENGALVTDPKAYQDFWTKLYALMKSDPRINMNYVLFDLMNEPVDVPNDAVFTTQAEVIKSLREQGFEGYILVEGNYWSGLHSWVNQAWTSTDGKTQYTNATLFSRDNFAKAGITDLNKILINVHQYLDDDFSGTKGTCVTDLNTIGPKGFNLNAFAEYLKENRLKAIVTEFAGTTKDVDNCTIALNNFLTYLQDHAVDDKEYGFVGWTIWSAGHGWGSTYPLRVTPTSFQMKILKNYLS